MDLRAFPGADFVVQGLSDLASGRNTIEAALVCVGAPRLRAAGLEVPPSPYTIAEHEVWHLLAAQDPDSAHSRYNALIRRLVSFERALESANLRSAVRRPDP